MDAYMCNIVIFFLEFFLDTKCVPVGLGHRKRPRHGHKQFDGQRLAYTA